MLRAALLAAMLAGTAQATPQLVMGRLVLAPGDWAVVRLDPALGTSLVRFGDTARAAPLGAGELRARLSSSLDNQTLLVVENATATPLDYDASLLLANGETRAIQLCSLNSGGKPGYELWRSAMTSVSIGNFKPIGTLAMHCP